MVLPVTCFRASRGFVGKVARKEKKEEREREREEGDILCMEGRWVGSLPPTWLAGRASISVHQP